MSTLTYSYSCLENPMGRGAWWAAVHGVAKSRTRLSNFTFTFHFLALEKEMAAHSSILAWRIPGTAEPGRLPSKGSRRVGHDWIDFAASMSAVFCSCFQLAVDSFEPVTFVVIVKFSFSENYTTSSHVPNFSNDSPQDLEKYKLPEKWQEGLTTQKYLYYSEKSTEFSWSHLKRSFWLMFWWILTLNCFNGMLIDRDGLSVEQWYFFKRKV